MPPPPARPRELMTSRRTKTQPLARSPRALKAPDISSSSKFVKTVCDTTNRDQTLNRGNDDGDENYFCRVSDFEGDTAVR